jgi:hypothetical protein
MLFFKRKCKKEKNYIGKIFSPSPHQVMAKPLSGVFTFWDKSNESVKSTRNERNLESTIFLLFETIELYWSTDDESVIYIKIN